MAKKVFNAVLTVDSINNLKKELLDYKNQILQSKIESLVQELAQLGIQVAEQCINDSPLGKYVTIRIESNDTQYLKERTIIATGEVKVSDKFADFNTLLAIEFGAGIYHNKKPNPNADKLGYGVGTFPGQIHAFEDGWYYWDEKEQEWRYTHGVKATMPMYNAEIEMEKEVRKLAKEIFARRV